MVHEALNNCNTEVEHKVDMCFKHEVDQMRVSIERNVYVRLSLSEELDTGL